MTDGATGMHCGSAEAGKRERERIRLLVERDARDAARAWVRRTRDLYAAAIRSPASHASSEAYRKRFEASIRAFDEWLAREDHASNDRR